MMLLLNRFQAIFMDEKVHNVIIIGSGPAGFTAGIYACRANLQPVLITGNARGGQLTTTPDIGNWPGESDLISGFELMQKLEKHAVKLGVQLISREVVESRLDGPVKQLVLDDGTVLKSKAVIIATGATARYLGVDGEKDYIGRGVSVCATCDGFFFKNKTAMVVGGGSAAFVDALFLCNLCSKVYLVHRREGFRAEQILVGRFKEQVRSGKAEFLLNYTAQAVKGDGNKVTGIVLKHSDGSLKEVAVDGVFAAIGHDPATAVFSQLQKDEGGFIKVGFDGRDTAASIKGVFAAGDCCDHIYRQAITSAGTGCKAALDAEHYLLGK